MNRDAQEPTVPAAETDAANSAPSSGQVIVGIVSWIACGFNHHYEPTGRTKKELDLIPVVLKEVRCRDCGHRTWHLL